MEQSLHNKIFAATGCLSEEQLLKYSHDALSKKERHKVEKHLIECELCTDALEGFAFAPAAAEINDIRSRVQQISYGKPAAVKHWKRFLLAASIIGMAFISFYFVFQKNKPLERKLLSENIKSEQPVSGEEIKIAEENPGNGKDISSGETGIQEESKKNGKTESQLKFKKEKKPDQTAVADELAEIKDESAHKDLISTVSGTSTAMVYDKKTVSGQDEWEKEIAEGEKKEEPESLAYTEETIKKESEIAGNDGDLLPAAQSPVMEEDASKNYRSETAGKRKAEESAAGAKGAAAKKASVKSAASDVKYLENYKVVDYSEEYTPETMPEIKSIPAQFENSEKAKEVQSELKLQTKNIMYDDILKEGLADIEAKNYAGALEKFDLILKNYPGDLNAVFYSGLTYYHTGNYDKALTNFNAVTSSDNIAFHDEANWYKALAYQQKNEKEKARALFREISGRENFYKTRAAGMLEEMEK